MIISRDEAVSCWEYIKKNGKVFPTSSPDFVMTDSLRENNSKPMFFKYNDGENLFFLPFNLGYVDDYGFFDVQSQYGYGGPCFICDNPAFMEKSWQLFAEWCKFSDVLACFFRFHPLFNNSVGFFGKVSNNRKTVAIKLDSDFFDNYSKKLRNKIRSLKNKLIYCLEIDKKTVSVDKLLVDIIEMYNKTMENNIANNEYFFSLQYWVSLFELKDSRFFEVYNNDDEPLAFALVLSNNSHVAEYYLGASTKEGYLLEAMKLLINYIAVTLANEGVKYLHLGGGDSPDENNSLLFFKKRFSSNIFDFKIGSYVFDEDKYFKLKNSLKMDSSKKILFYR